MALHHVYLLFLLRQSYFRLVCSLTRGGNPSGWLNILPAPGCL